MSATSTRKCGWVAKKAGNWSFWPRWWVELRFEEDKKDSALHFLPIKSGGEDAGNDARCGSTDGAEVRMGAAQVKWCAERAIKLARCTAIVQPEHQKPQSGASEGAEKEVHELQILCPSAVGGEVMLRFDSAAEREEWHSCLVAALDEVGPLVVAAAASETPAVEASKHSSGSSGSSGPGYEHRASPFRFKLPPHQQNAPPAAPAAPAFNFNFGAAKPSSAPAFQPTFSFGLAKEAPPPAS